MFVREQWDKNGEVWFHSVYPESEVWKVSVILRAGTKAKKITFKNEHTHTKKKWTQLHMKRSSMYVILRKQFMTKIEVQQVAENRTVFNL